MTKNTQKYRPDIDGLRAVAVLLVLAFHLQVPLVHGGFIGVDVFFVISGFLISGIIVKEIASDSFSFAAFYERRARRILPALVAVIIASTLLGFHYLLPQELSAYAKSMLGALFSFSNIFFWATEDYFDAPAQIKPLLHSWSLAVEEQFYLFLPLFLVLLSRLRVSFRNVILGIVGVTSLVWSALAAYHSPSAAFYLLPSRAWELLAGTVLALGYIPPIRRRWLADSIGLSGIALIIYSANTYSATTPFPGLAAITPCLGAAMVICAGTHPSSVITRILSLAPIRFIGLISYSVYLWHWPLIVFVKMGFLSFLTRSAALSRLVMMGLSLALGALSWKFVEQPFRAGQFRTLPRRQLFGASLAAMTSLAAIAALFIAMRGLEWRFPARAVQVASQSQSPEQMRVGTCFITSRYGLDAYRPDLCLKLDPARENWLLLGDSHSAMLWEGLNQDMTSVHILQASTAGCNPVYGASRRNDCGRMMNYIFNDFLPNHKIQGVFLTARWTNQNDFRSLRPTVDWFKRHNIHVYLIGPVAEYDTPLPRLLAYSIAFGDPDLADQHMKKEFFALDNQMKHVAQDTWHVDYISIIDLVCTSHRCPEYADSSQTQPFLGDDNHLSTAGSVLVAQKLMTSESLARIHAPLLTATRSGHSLD